MDQTKGLVTFKGRGLTLEGRQLKVADKSPDFSALAQDLSEVKLSSFAGKTVLIASVPSLDTGVCDMEARRFNTEAAGFGEALQVLVISMDLPFAQKRWCGAAGVKNVRTLSDHRDAKFGTAYGVLIKELRLLARAVFVVDKAGRIRYIQVVDELSNEPDYEAALKALKETAK